MDSKFKAVIVGIVASPFCFALVALIEKMGWFSFSKYGAWQVITFLIGLSYALADHYFDEEQILDKSTLHEVAEDIDIVTNASESKIRSITNCKSKGDEKKDLLEERG